MTNQGLKQKHVFFLIYLHLGVKRRVLGQQVFFSFCEWYIHFKSQLSTLQSVGIAKKYRVVLDFISS